MTVMSVTSLSSGPALRTSAGLSSPTAQAVADRLQGLIGAPTDTPVLNTLALPDKYLRGLAAVLGRLGYTPREAQLEQAFVERTVFRFTVIAQNDHEKALLCFGEILGVFSRSVKLALDEVRDVFQAKYKVLYVFHGTSPCPVFKNILLSEWAGKYGIAVKLIPLVDLDGLESLGIDQQAEYLKRELQLDSEATAPRKSADDMTVTEVDQLGKNVVAELAEFNDARGRRVFIETTGGLEAFAKDFDFEGAPTKVAGDLVLLLLKKKLLGCLLAKLKDMTLPREAQRFVEDLLRRYSFDSPAPPRP